MSTRENIRLIARASLLQLFHVYKSIVMSKEHNTWVGYATVAYAELGTFCINLFAIL